MQFGRSINADFMEVGKDKNDNNIFIILKFCSKQFRTSFVYPSIVLKLHSFLYENCNPIKFLLCYGMQAYNESKIIDLLR